MRYDLVHGYSTVTVHHTPLYSTQQQKQSTNNAVQRLLDMGVPAKKLVIGSAFYGRVWENVPDSNNGLYQQGKFLTSVPYKNFWSRFSTDSGFIYHWDDMASVPFLYRPLNKVYVTFDDKRSITLKTKYVIDRVLGGIMFWQLGSDTPRDGLLQVIYYTKVNYAKQ